MLVGALRRKRHLEIRTFAALSGLSVQQVYSIELGSAPLETVLACLTSNAAAVLKLGAKGNLAPCKDADVLILKQDSLEIVHLFARGRHVIRDGHYVEPSRQEQQVESGKE